MTNGRITDLHMDNLTKYEFFNEQNKDPDHFRSQAVKHIHTESAVSNLFFSIENIDVVHDGIRYGVYKKTKEVISRQSEPELQIVMRSIYLQFAKNTSDNVVLQVKDLNAKVLDYTIHYISNQLYNYKRYTTDISTMPIPMERSKNMSSVGTKNL